MTKTQASQIQVVEIEDGAFYQAQCECGWTDKPRRRYSKAAEDAQTHLAWC